MPDCSDQLNKAVARELRAQRDRINITIDQLVTRTGLSKSTVWSYLKGERASLNPFVNLCFALDSTPTVILDAADMKLGACNEIITNANTERRDAQSWLH